MTDDPDDFGVRLNEELRAAVARRRGTPRDVVPHHPEPTDEDLLRWHDDAGRAVTVTDPGEVLLDPDGLPFAVGPSPISSATLTAPLLTRDQRARLDHLLDQRDDNDEDDDPDERNGP